MRYVGPLAMVLTICVLVGVSLASGERGYCRIIHLVAKPVGLGALALWLGWWGSRDPFAAWTRAQRAGWIALFVTVFLLHAYGAIVEAPPMCTQPVCS